MEKIVTLKNVNDINKYSHFDSYLVESIFSSFCLFTFAREELFELVNQIHSLNKKIYLKADKILIEKEIYLLNDYREIFNIVDGVFFEDFAFVTYFEKENIQTELIYYPYDAIGDKEDVLALFDFNISRICIPGSKTYLLCDFNNRLGYRAIYNEVLFNTRRKILSLYNGINDVDIDKRVYDIQEKTRNTTQRVFETDSGSLIILKEPTINPCINDVSFAVFDRTFIEDAIFDELLKEGHYE